MQNVDQHVLFVQGGGKDAHAWDAKLARSLANELGPGYDVAFPEMPNEADPNYAAWRRCILDELEALGEGVVLAGHSLGGSMLLKMLTEGDFGDALRGVFIISAPFFHETEGGPWAEAQIPPNAEDRLPAGLPVFLYHGQDDDEVPFSHLGLHAKALPRAQTRALAGRNHQLNDDLTEVADDIRKLAR
jgi:predicted alpha/beta hydrolase family esterase